MRKFASLVPVGWALSGQTDLADYVLTSARGVHAKFCRAKPASAPRLQRSLPLCAAVMACRFGQPQQTSLTISSDKSEKLRFAIL